MFMFMFHSIMLHYRLTAYPDMILSCASTIGTSYTSDTSLIGVLRSVFKHNLNNLRVLEGKRVGG